MSPPGMAAAGFVFAESPLPVKPPVHRPPGVEEHGGGEARRWTGSARARRAGAMVPAGAGPGPPTWRATRCACRARRQGASSRRRWSTMSCRTAATQSCSGTRRNWQRLCKPCHDAKTAREGRWG